MKILIAENDEAHQEIYEILMQDWGFDYDMISNGRQAFDLAKANEGEYDLCLMDIDMPVMDGWDAAKLIRQKLKYFPIAALTANPCFNDRYLEIGMDDYIEKPYDMNQLYKRIKELTVKSKIVYFKDDSVQIRKEMPMDQQHAQELRDLAKKNLRKVKFFDSPASSLIVHKNVTNKISHDFNVKRQLLTTFINRDPDKPTRCELYKESNYLMPQTYITEEECDNLIEQEDAELEKYPELSLTDKEGK